MIQAEVFSPATPRAVNPTTVPTPRMDKTSTANVAARMFEMTYQAVEMDGRNLWREKRAAAVSQLVEAVRLADLRGKAELYICDITPWIKVGQADTGQVPIIQDRIQENLRIACEQIGREMPVCRLDLRRGEFGIRCYLGKNRPVDFIHAEDLISDSR